METNFRLQELTTGYLNKSLTEQEKDELLDYFHNPLFANEIADRLGKEFDKGLEDFEMDEQQQAAMLENVFRQPDVQVRPLKKGRRRWLAGAAAAAAIIIGVWAYQAYQSGNQTGIKTAYKNDAPPAKNMATLTMANGQVIVLSDTMNSVMLDADSLKYENGKAVAPDVTIPVGKMIANTNRGQTYKFTLPDGSKVQMNASSTLTIAFDTYGRTARRVNLEGEAYFEVARNQSLPFIVESRGQQVEVLGTRFNINAYADEPSVSTTLLEGSIRLSARGRKMLMKPGQQAVNTEKGVDVRMVDVSDAVDWISGDFNFDHVDFREVMREISRWYDVDVVYDSSVPADIRSGGWISRSNNLSAVLRSIERSGQVRFRVDGRTIYVTK